MDLYKKIATTLKTFAYCGFIFRFLLFFFVILWQDYKDIVTALKIINSNDFDSNNDVDWRTVAASNEGLQEQYPGEACNRLCVEGDRRVCYFHFILEHYQAMGVACGDCVSGNSTECTNRQCIVGDGTKKAVMSINRQIPGPSIEVCAGDYIIVDVTNTALGTAATIHWHGLPMDESPIMDGVPFITQCPILYSNTFRYEYKATKVGTHFYHSHSGFHKINGQYGALIIREPQDEDPLRNEYDYDLSEHILLISDWMHQYAEEEVPGLGTSRGIFPDSLLINGHGQYNPNQQNQLTPPTIFYVKSNTRYRFRLINAISHSITVKMQIEKHTFNVIATDSNNVRPHTVDTLMSNSGERFDFVLNANHSDGDFWIRVQSFYVPHAGMVEAYALLRYIADVEDAGRRDNNWPPYPHLFAEWPEHQILNNPNATCMDEYSADVCITQLKPFHPQKTEDSSLPNHTFFLEFTNSLISNEQIFNNYNYNHFMNPIHNATLIGTINNISWTSPSSPLLSQFQDVDEAQYCSANQLPPKCRGPLCSCIHRLQVKYRTIVEMVLTDGSRDSEFFHHPFHLHGYHFEVVGLGRLPYTPFSSDMVRNMYENHQLPRIAANESAIYKDTISIPNNGYALIRFIANNPGFWLIHCHYQWHSSTGMELVMQVGEVSQMSKTPNNFPRCGNYQPKFTKTKF